MVGIACGRMLAYVAFRASSRSLRVAERGESLLALAALIASYGVGEVLGGYGFLSVFVCAMTFRSAERSHDYHAAMHEVAERLERLLTLFVLLMLGIALTRGPPGRRCDWRGVAIGLALIVLVRPLAGMLVAAAPWAKPADEPGGLTTAQRWAAAFFGVRGVGSLYYLAYAAGEASELGQDWLWSTVAFTVVASVLVHGVAVDTGHGQAGSGPRCFVMRAARRRGGHRAVRASRTGTNFACASASSASGSESATMPQPANSRTVVPVELRGAQRDAPLAVAGGVHPADRAGVAAAVHLLDLGDQRGRDRGGGAADGGGGVQRLGELQATTRSRRRGRRRRRRSRGA